MVPGPTKGVHTVAYCTECDWAYWMDQEGMVEEALYSHEEATGHTTWSAVAASPAAKNAIDEREWPEARSRTVIDP